MNFWAIEQAYRLCKINPKLKSDWYCCISIACQQKNINRLTDNDLHIVTYHWLASIMYHKIPTIN